MLVDADAEVTSASNDPILEMMARLDGKEPDPKKLATGVYEVGHFGSSGILHGWEHYPDLGGYGCYGVSDGPANLLAVVTTLQDPDRKFIALLTKVQRDVSNKGRGGGWRWHKWGEYIGRHTPTTEYLDDEPEIDFVYCYHIYERQ